MENNLYQPPMNISEFPGADRMQEAYTQLSFASLLAQKNAHERQTSFFEKQLAHDELAPANVWLAALTALMNNANADVLDLMNGNTQLDRAIEKADYALAAFMARFDIKTGEVKNMAE